MRIDHLIIVLGITGVAIMTALTGAAASPLWLQILAIVLWAAIAGYTWYEAHKLVTRSLARPKTESTTEQA